jgi:hypothetical protein
VSERRARGLRLQGRTFRGVKVDVEYGVPTMRGEGARVVLPDRSEIIVTKTDDHDELDGSICYQVQKWRVAKWRESGHGGVI